MANVKQIHIEARVPFHLFDDEQMGKENAAFFASVFLGPSMGLQITFHDDGYEPNDRGGQTSMYRCSIFGQEALAFAATERIRDCLDHVGEVTLYDVIDIEDVGEAE